MVDLCIMHLFQTTNAIQTFVFCSGINTWNGSLCRKYTWGEKVLFCISGVCDHKVSLMRHSLSTLKRGLHLIPKAPRCSLSTSPKNTAANKQQNSTPVPLLFSQTNVWHLPSFTLNISPCTAVKEYLLTFTGNSCLRAPERMIWGRRLPKISCLFISYVQSFRYCSLYLNIYIYISPEWLAWN